MIYQVVKLSNGEDIICTVVENQVTQLKISAPLKMETISKVTSSGAAQSLALGRWLQPYSDEETFQIEKSSIVIMTPASIGLSRYYEYVIRSIHRMELVKLEPSEEELEIIEEQEFQQSYDEAEEELQEYDISIATRH